MIVCITPQILYEDDEIIAVSKPAGMVVHPAPGSWNGTFVNALVFHLENSGEAGRGEKVVGGIADAGFRSMPDGEHNPGLRPGIVHRLDKGTTGVLLAAKNPTMQAKLAELFAQRRVSHNRRCLCRCSFRSCLVGASVAVVMVVGLAIDQRRDYVYVSVASDAPVGKRKR